jgi:hypothetical protein
MGPLSQRLSVSRYEATFFQLTLDAHLQTAQMYAAKLYVRLTLLYGDNLELFLPWTFLGA